MNRFLEEVREMPCALRRLADYYAGEGHRNLQRFAEIADGCGEIIFAGMGSSESAPLAILPGLSAAGVKGAHGGSIGIRIADAGEWLHYGTAAAPSALAVLVSQSGESFETRALAERGFVSSYVAITNNEHSSLAARANLTLPLCAGDEASVSNKTYANTLAVLYLLSAVLRRKPIEAALEELRSTADRLHALDECAVEAAAPHKGQGLASAH